MLQWRYAGCSVHNRIRSKAAKAKGRQRLARYMIRCPFALEKMCDDKKSGMVTYRSKLYATLKRNYQLMLALKWLRMLMNHIADKYEHLVRYYGYHSNGSRGARRSAEQASDPVPGLVIDDAPVDTRLKVSWARLIQRVYEVDPLECVHRGTTMRTFVVLNDEDGAGIAEMRFESGIRLQGMVIVITIGAGLGSGVC